MMDLGFALVFDPCNTCSKKDMCSMCELTFRRNGAVANSATTTSEWISVEERLPEVGESVLGYTKERDECFVVTYSNTFKSFFSGQFPNDNITHWMPLPEPPKKGGAE